MPRSQRFGIERTSGHMCGMIFAVAIGRMPLRQTLFYYFSQLSLFTIRS